MPPLRELAPQPMVWVSSTATLMPRRASARAAQRPVMPPPMTATSTRVGSASFTAEAAGTRVMPVRPFLQLSRHA